MSKFKIGEKVLVRPDLKLYACYNNCSFVREMIPFRGKIVTIVDVIDVHKSYCTTRYHIKEDYKEWFWANDMLIPIPKDKNFINLKYYVPSI